MIFEFCMKDKSNTICFVIMPISNQTGYEEKHFQYVYEDIIIPAIEAAGMEPLLWLNELVHRNRIKYS